MLEPDRLKKLLVESAWGDREAFASLYQITAPYLLSLAVRIVHSRELAEEVLQEAFVQIWYGAKDYDAGKGAAMAWLAGVVRHRALDTRRREGSQQSRASAAALEPQAEAVPDTAVKAHYSYDLQAMLGCMELLQEPQKQSILLAYCYGFSHHEIAERLTTPLGTIKTWIRRGMQSVRECLKL
jgi:RNA polymerase sigma-70 factor (ECF subfamily)